MLTQRWAVKVTMFACWTHWQVPCIPPPSFVQTEPCSNNRFSTVIGGKFLAQFFNKCLTKTGSFEFPFSNRYNVDCAEAEGLYGLAEGAFGSAAGGAEGGSSGGGQCPNANPLSDAECAGAVSNCWSPGQPDTDCPNFGLCCFDGCANTCVDGPAPQGKWIINLYRIFAWLLMVHLAQKRITPTMSKSLIIVLHILPRWQKKPVDFDDELKIGDVRYDNMTKITIKVQLFWCLPYMKCDYAQKLTVYE